MGGELFDVFRDLTQKADDILGYSIKTLCLENPNRELNQTQFSACQVRANSSSGAISWLSAA
jgi:hypothetical protein